MSDGYIKIGVNIEDVNILHAIEEDDNDVIKENGSNWKKSCELLIINKV